MAEWWYITIHRCPDCKDEYEVFDSSGPWYDSGLWTAPVVLERCPDCWEEFTRADREAQDADDY